MERVGMIKFPKRGEVYWVKLDPTIGSEINKTRPALIVSNDSGNEYSQRVIVAPITSSVKKVYPFEVQLQVGEKDGKVLLDQLRSIDKQRLSKKISVLDYETMQLVNKALKITLDLT
jgi:mRNA interferase MazF